MNSYVKLYEDFNAGASLQKVYLCLKKSSGQRWWNYKGFAGNKFFVQINEDNIDKLYINPNYPVLNYQSEIVNQLLESGKIKNKNIYNHPKIIKNSGSKEKFHKIVGTDENIPKTVFSFNEAKNNLKFPIIAKPSEGHSGIGIQIIQSKDEFNKIDKSKFDTFSEFIDKKEEHRFFIFKGNVFFWMERKPENEKAKSGSGRSDEQMEFSYQKRKIENLPDNINKVLKRFSKKFSDFPFICFDVMIDKSDKPYIIESNSQPGVPFDSTVELYKLIYQDHFRKKLDRESELELEDYAKTMIEKTLNKDNGRFSIEE